MKILAIYCGRSHGFSEALAKTALGGAAEQGAEVEAVNLMDLDIKPCINCGTCMRVLTDDTFYGKCPFEEDDIKWLDQRILESDGLIFVAPMFEKAVPANYKLMCDRMGPSHDVTFQRFAYDRRVARGEDPRIDSRWFVSRPVSFIGHGGSEWSQLSYPTMASPAISCGLTIVDRLQFDWNSDLLFREEDIRRVRESGKHVAKMAAVPNPKERSYIGPKGHCPVCHNDVMVLAEDSTDVCCSVCGIHGTLEVKEGKIAVTFREEEMAKAHILETGRRIHLEDMQKNDRVKKQHTPQEWNMRKKELCAGIETTKP